MAMIPHRIAWLTPGNIITDRSRSFATTAFIMVTFYNFRQLDVESQ